MHARTLAAATAFVLLVVTRAHADASSDAKDLFDRARELRASGDCAGALPLFHKAHEIFPTALGPLRNAAECEESTGRWASARRSWLDLKRAVMMSHDAKYNGWEADADSAAERLAPRVSHLTVDVSTGGSTDGALEVTINGEALPKTLVGTTLDRDPGKYVVRARVPGAEPVEQSTDLVTGEARTVRLVLAPHAATVAPPPPPPSEHRAMSAWTVGGVVTTSLGVVALAGMVVAIGVRQGALDTLTSECHELRVLVVSALGEGRGRSRQDRELGGHGPRRGRRGPRGRGLRDASRRRDLTRHAPRRGPPFADGRVPRGLVLMRAAAGLTALAAMLASCTFPDVTFLDASTPDSSVDAPVLGDGAGGDAGCDEDQDGYLSQACGGDDCNDHDARVHPNAADGGFVFDVPSGFPNGDWNCDGVVEKEWPFVACGLTSCQAQSFAVDTACGATAQFVSCTGTLACAAVDAGSRTQGCR